MELRRGGSAWEEEEMELMAWGMVGRMEGISTDQSLNTKDKGTREVKRVKAMEGLIHYRGRLDERHEVQDGSG